MFLSQERRVVCTLTLKVSRVRQNEGEIRFLVKCLVLLMVIRAATLVKEMWDAFFGVCCLNISNPSVSIMGAIEQRISISRCC